MSKGVREKAPRREVPAAFISAIAIGTPIEDAAAHCGVTERTGYRWLNKPGVRQAVTELRDHLTSQALGSLVEQMRASVQKLVKLLEDPSPHVQLQAAKSILAMGLDFREAVNIQDRLAELERRLSLRDEAMRSDQEEPCP